MSGKQAKILKADHIDDLLSFAETTRHPLRDRVIVLLSVKAGLRAAEIANLTWDMVVDAGSAISTVLELRDSAAKMGHGRAIPLHAELRDALIALKRNAGDERPVVLSERGGKMKSRSIVIWFAAPIGPSASMVAPPIPDAAHLLLGLLVLFMRLAGLFVMCSFWRGIDLSKPLKATSRATVTPKGSWYHSYECSPQSHRNQLGLERFLHTEPLPPLLRRQAYRGGQLRQRVVHFCRELAVG